MAIFTAPLTDIAVNLCDKRFDKDRDEVIERAHKAGVQRLILVSSQLAESETHQTLCRNRPGSLYCTAGMHPHHAAEWQAGDAEQLRQLAKQSQVIAIGEAGLDFNRDFSPRPMQETAFSEQVALAGELRLPLLLHERDAHTRLVDIYTTEGASVPGAVLHCFTGDRTALHRYLDLGFYIGITGWICDERRGLTLQELVTEIPDDRLLLETDAPYLLPRDLRPKPKSGRNEPAFLPHIANQVAKLRGQSPELMAEQLERNVCSLFKRLTN